MEQKCYENAIVTSAHIFSPNQFLVSLSSLQRTLAYIKIREIQNRAAGLGGRGGRVCRPHHAIR